MKKFLVFGLALAFLQGCSIEERPVPAAPTFGEITGTGGAGQNSFVSFQDFNGQIPNLTLQQDNSQNFLDWSSSENRVDVGLKFIGVDGKESAHDVLLRFRIDVGGQRGLQTNRVYTRSDLRTFLNYYVTFQDYGFSETISLGSALQSFEVNFTELSANSVTGTLYIEAGNSTLNVSHHYSFSIKSRSGQALINW